jgi:catalase
LLQSCCLDAVSDIHRKDLAEAIECGAYPKWTFAVQIIEPEDEHKFDFDVLDATKLWPQDLVPLHEIGELVLNRTVDEFFSEVEQAAFCTSRVVPGIGFNDDPLLQGRNFSYLTLKLLGLVSIGNRCVRHEQTATVI